MNLPENQDTLYYFHDPMCSWCWAFESALSRVLLQLPDGLQVRRILGGLAEDSNEPMSVEMQEYLKATWLGIQDKVSGVRFNFDFWDLNQPRRSTYPACRAVIAARKQGIEYDSLMTSAIQSAYYQRAKNPSDHHILVSLAGDLGMDIVRFERDIISSAVDSELKKEIEFSRSIGVNGFPTLVLQIGRNYRKLSHDYQQVDVVLREIHNSIDTNQ